MTSLSLNGNQLGDSDMAVLADGLLENGCLLDLSLSYNCIGALGSTLLATALHDNRHLRVLDLMHNQIGSEGVRPWLGTTLRVNRVLQQLKLSHNRIGDAKVSELLDALAPKPVTHNQELKLQISRRHTAAVAAAPVARIAEPDDSEPFNSTLSMLLLGDTGIGDEAAPHLAHVLAKTKSLEHLDISSNAFSPHGNALLARGMQRNRTLRSLNCSANAFDDMAAVALLRALATHNFIETASFQACFTSGQSAVASAAGELVRGTRSLHTLDLVGHCPNVAC